MVDTWCFDNITYDANDKDDGGDDNDDTKTI